MTGILVEVRRGRFVESVHRGSVVVVDTAGTVLWSAGDPEMHTFMRSSAKPIQALAVVETGAYEAFGLTERELAVMCGSHSGEPAHVETVLGILEKTGLSEAHLKCGTHRPVHRPSADELVRRGRQPTAVHCNCSGKHAGMLAVARHMGWSLDDYWREDHPVQRLCLENLAEVAGYPASGIGVAADGCGAAVFALPLRNMALAFARMARPEDPCSGFPPERASAASLVVRSMRAHPDMVAGTGRLCTALMTHTAVFAKGGAEAVYCLGVPERGLGVAVKIEDGNYRAVGPVVLRVLEELGLLSPEAARALEGFARPLMKNHRGEVTGAIETVLRLRKELTA